MTTEVSDIAQPGDRGLGGGSAPPRPDIRAGVLRTYSRLLRMVLDEIDEAVLVFDASGAVILSNAALENLFGVSADASRLADLRQFLAAIGTVIDADALAVLMSPEPANLRLQLRDGSDLEARVSPLGINAPADHRLMTFGPAAGLELHELRHRAFHDSLTGLPNRHLLLDRLELALARRAREGGAVGVVFVDLDGFKMINDVMGHAVGDQVLIEVAERLAREIRPVDTVGRLGGDEFVIVCDGLADTHAIELVCARVQRAMTAPLVIGGDILDVGASLGAVVEWNSDAVADDLLARADEQMYRAKRRGTQIEIARTPLLSVDERRLGLVRALQTALRDDEVELVYLPLISLGNERVVGVEALLRCSNAELHGMAPMDLVHLAEEGGAIGQLNAWVLRHAATAARSLGESTGAELSVLINLSAAQLADAALADQIAATATAVGIEPRLLGFDIAESVITAGSTALEAQLDRLAELGCQLFADDVTSPGPLVMLAELGIRAIKIDGAMVETAADAPHVASEIRALVARAHEVRLSVVAEGIVDERALRVAREIGCNGAQGYGFYGFPRPLDQLRQLIV